MINQKDCQKTYKRHKIKNEKKNKINKQTIIKTTEKKMRNNTHHGQLFQK